MTGGSVEDADQLCCVIEEDDNEVHQPKKPIDININRSID
jgi:hypothetical protein